MITVVIVIHLLLALSLVGLVLVQRSEGGGLGMGSSGGGGGGGFMSGRETANFLTRTTAYVAAGFFATSLLLAILAGSHRESGSLLDKAPVTTEQPAAPTGPSVPVK